MITKLLDGLEMFLGVGVMFLRASISVCRPCGALWLAGYVYHPPAWCGAVSTASCGERGDPHPLWRSSLVKNRIKVTVVT